MREHVRAAFHESYFEHPCNVMTERDVLDTDIKGNSRGAKLKRWFHSWFLLSYNDERCRIYYVSSHALRLERARHFQRYRGRIHPLSKFSNLWTVFIFIAMILNRLLFHLNTKMIYGKSTATTHVIGVAIEMIFLIDFIINFKTGYTDKVARNVILDATMGYVHYISTNFFFHFISAMPLQTIMVVRYGLDTCPLCKANLFMCTLKLLGIFNMVRLFEVSAFLSRPRSSFTKMHVCKCLRIVVLALFTMMYYLDLTDALNLIVIIKTQQFPKDSYISMIMRIRIKLKDWPNYFFVCVEFSIICKSVVLFGYGMYRHDYYLDKICSLVCHLLSSIFCTWAFMECFAIIHQQKYLKDEIIVHKIRTENWLRSIQLSNMISEKVRDYQMLDHCRLKAVERHNKMYKFLPSVLIKEITLSCYYKYVRRIPYFSEWPENVVEDIVLLLKNEMYLERDVVSYPLTQGEGLVIVFAGVLAVYNVSQQETGHLIDGDYFGELSLVTDKELRTSAVSAVTECHALLLSKDLFRKTMRKYPNLFFELRTMLLQNYDLANSYTEFPAFDAN